MASRFHITSILIASLSLTGCVTDRGLGGTPVVGHAPDRAVIGLALIVKNIKCDMLGFMRDNSMLTDYGRTMGGTLTFTINRSNDSGAGVKIGIPIVTGVKVNAGVDLTKSRTFGEAFSTPFVVNYKPGDQEIDCAGVRSVSYTTKEGKTQPAVIKSPILDVAALRPELDAIDKGEPKIKFVDFVFKGSIFLATFENDSAGIDIYFISPSVSDKISSDYKIDYEIGTNWQKILTDAGYSIVSSSSPETVADIAARPKDKKADQTASADAPTKKVGFEGVTGPTKPALYLFKLGSTGEIVVPTSPEPKPSPTAEPQH